MAPTKKKNSRTEEKTLHQNRERKQMQHTLKIQNKKKNSNKKMKSIRLILRKKISYKNLRKNILRGKKEQRRIKSCRSFLGKSCTTGLVGDVIHHW